MQFYEPQASERMTSDEARRVTQLLGERLKETVSIEELAATMGVPREQVYAALAQVRRGSPTRLVPDTRLDVRVFAAAVAGVALVWALFLTGFVATSAPRPSEAPVVVEIPAPGTPVVADMAPELAPPAPAPVAPSPTR